MSNIELGQIEGNALDVRKSDGTLIRHYEPGETIRLDTIDRISIAPCRCERKS